MKRFFLLLFLVGAVIIGGGIYILFGSATSFEPKAQSIILKKDKLDKSAIMAEIKERELLDFPWAFELVADYMGLWNHIKAGKYEIRKGERLISIIRMFKNNRQVPVNLVINKLRTKEDFAKLIGKNFAIDSTEVMTFLLSNDSLQSFDVDTNTVFTIILPNTYTFYYNTSLSKIFTKITESSNNFWNEYASQVAATGMTKQQLYTLSSIVEEETNNDAEKGNIASVYINRYKKGMALGADPTVKYALRNFALRRILYGHLKTPSPYNTYLNKGLPPGPICTPTATTIKHVINAPSTNYLYFVASSSFNGTHHFSSNFAEHIQYAKQYQLALDTYLAQKKAP